MRPGHRIVDSALYKVRTRRRLAELLFTEVGFLESLEKNQPKYVVKYKPKYDDKAPWLAMPPPPELADNYRPISLPPTALKRLQARLAKLLGMITVPPYVFSSVKGVSYVDNAAVHVGARAFWLLDIEAFLPSCTAERLTWFFRDKLQCSPDVAAILVEIVTFDGCLPQGSPCSPILSYFCNARMWSDIYQLAGEYGCTLSIYADDITLSGAVVPKKLVWRIKEVLKNNGFRTSRSKEVSLVNAPADITGVIVRDNKLFLPNRQFKKLRVELAKRRDAKTSIEKRKIDNRIAGRKAQARQIEKHSKSGR
ncbi:MAG: hypothetical protein CML24_08340 [Rhizobiales bacterium]|nr:hypothetical protein [Hyphomicrobiales bacterium]